MLRWTIALLLAIAAIEPTISADKTLARRGYYRAAANLPAGLPRRHYNFRTTISYGPPYTADRSYAHRAFSYEPPDVLFTPAYVEVPYIRPWLGAPLLPWGLTADYGSPYSYDYLTPYYGAPNSYIGPYYYPDTYSSPWDRLPYACGGYGYC